ncbi:uncharacterized protein [Parasteatoda tepidariorum]|uniref:uncharacterized protein n=1 Tax=Parasteatoda tepidariorum TaxID=114398 RepID=UPI001C728E26|nr:uncharacterized protein LOC107443535 [Parasteatoda tepidariorum]XP_042899422.1 uncharacterized protein LOC107443535 [Parasteatoda tepidariorum]
MRIVQIRPELFLYKLDVEEYKFFRKNRNALKKMWTAQGPTYWLRFLLTYQLSFEDYASNHAELSAFVISHYERHVPDFVYIRIHKQIVESTFERVESFIENVFRIVQNFHKASLYTTENPIYSEESLEHLSSAMEQNDSGKVTYSGIVSLLCIMYCGFVDGFLKLLRKWLKESDVSKEDENNIDLTIYYWRPQKSWECKKFMPTCFEKYLATHWGESLPKLLLTCDIYNIFNNHAEDEECSCQFKDEESIFGLLKDKYKVGKPQALSVVHIYKPETALCPEHNNCYVKLLHGKECLEPYICLGMNSTCSRTCETVLKSKHKEEVKDFWKKSIVEVFNCKKRSQRSVSTFVESCDSQIETFCPLSGSRRKQVSLDLEELFYCNYDPNFRNSYTQHKRKEEYRQKLRKKLLERYEYDSQDPAQLKDMYDEAQRLWLNEICFENYSKLFALQHNQPCDFDEQLFKVKKSLTTVAIGTSSLIFGRVVLPSRRRSSPKTNPTTEIKVNISTQKTSKRKKKKAVISTTTEITKVKIASSRPPETKDEANKTASLTDCSTLLDEVDCNSNSNAKCVESLVNTSSEHAESLRTTPKTQNKAEISNSGTVPDESDTKSDSKAKCVESSSNSDVVENGEKKCTKKSGTKTSKDLQLGLTELCNQGGNVEESKPSVSEVSSDVDDELNTFYSFVVNGEEKTDDTICNGTTTDLPNTENCNATGGNKEKKNILSERKSKLKICAYCSKQEVVVKSFKRCSRCKAENFPDQYFYCSRECQVADWEKSHRELHLKARTNH